MPNGEQKDIDAAKQLVEHLDIKHFIINIADSFHGLKAEIEKKMDGEISAQAYINMAPRIRMTTLYAIGQCFNGRVANTCNLSEDWVGYSTRYGDMAGDFSPLSHLTVTEAKAIGRELGLPANLVDKVPSDGLTNKTDEDNLGFTYAALDAYIRTGVCEDPVIKEKIDTRHRNNLFKLQPMPAFQYQPEE